MAFSSFSPLCFVLGFRSSYASSPTFFQLPLGSRLGSIEGLQANFRFLLLPFLLFSLLLLFGILLPLLIFLPLPGFVLSSLVIGLLPSFLLLFVALLPLFLGQVLVLLLPFVFLFFLLLLLFFLLLLFLFFLFLLLLLLCLLSRILLLLLDLSERLDPFLLLSYPFVPRWRRLLKMLRDGTAGQRRNKNLP